MPLVAAKCTNCGAALIVDSNKDAAICEFCGTPFIVEKAINNVTMGGNNSISVESAIINIQNDATVPSITNLLKRAEEFEFQNKYNNAIDYYERVLDLDYSNIVAKEAIDRINNTPISSIPISVLFGNATLTLTRKNLIYQTKKKTKVYPTKSILGVRRFFARLIISIENKPDLEYAVGNAKFSKEMSLAIKNLLDERQNCK